MRTFIIYSILGLLLSGCATVQKYGTTQNFARCGAADVATTAVGLSINNLHENNPVTRWIAVKLFGDAVLSSIPVAIGLYVATYFVLKKINEPRLTQAATILACGTAVKNAYIVVTHAPYAGTQ